jgi:hypothetical protein
MTHVIIQIARRALPLMPAAHRAEAIRIINSFERTANAHERDDELTAFYKRAAAAWQSDMQPASEAIVTALHAGDVGALRTLRTQLPNLLGQVNDDPALAGVLTRQLFRIFAVTIGSSPEAAPITANAATASLEHWRGRQIFPTDLSSADLRGFSEELHLRSIFSARTTNADYLNEVATVVDKILSSELNMAYGRLQLMRKLKQLGYDPETGFPQDMAGVPPAEKDSLQDLSSERRLDLMLKTNVAVVRNYGRVVEGNTPFARYAWPAWELKRLEARHTPRGSEDSHTAGWEQRWHDAGESVGWVGASRDRMIALKDSPIWPALAAGVGGYTDTLGHPFPPFAFNSGYDWRAVPRAECLDLQLIQGGRSSGEKDETGPMKATLAPQDNEVQSALAGLGPDFRAELLKELGGLAA